LLKRLETKYNCLLASDPVKALTLVEEYRDEIELIITDYQMPKMNGYEFLRKAQFEEHEIPVIMVSGSLSEIRVKDLYSLGVRIFMAKPVKINRLVREIDELIEESEEDEINKND
jgi:CheY-like chemotaxis protein